MGPAPMYPIPENMEGQRSRSPYSRFNTMFNPRLIASDLAVGALPGPTGLVDRFTGNRIRGFSDRLFGATDARNQREYDAYMRELMRGDPGNQSGLSRFFSGLRDRFSRGDEPQQPSQQPQQPPSGGGQRAPTIMPSRTGGPSWMRERFSSAPSMGRWSGESQELMRQSQLFDVPGRERNTML